MPETIPSCFRRNIAGAPPPSTIAGPTSTTSIYKTHIGLASFTWSRTLLGLSLHIQISSVNLSGDLSGDLSFEIRPWFFWKRKGSRRLRSRGAVVDVSYDLAGAKFHSSGGPQPASNFFVAVAINGEMIVFAGDMESKARNRISPAAPISRRDLAFLKPDGGARSYRAAARVSGRDREISISIGGMGMFVEVDGIRVLEVRRLRWMFRGREKIDVDGVGGMQISWNLYGWMFCSKEEVGKGVFVFTFEEEEEEEEEEGVFVGKEKRMEIKKKKEKSLLKMNSSSSSSSSVSSGGSFSVMDWGSMEEKELCGVAGFTLVVYAWKN